MVVGGLCRVVVTFNTLHNLWLSVKDTMDKKIEPWHWGGFLLLLFVLWIIFSNKKAKKRKKTLLEQINQRIELFVNNIKCSGYSLDFINRHFYLIRKCDMCITDDALILFLHDEGDRFPFIFTHNQEYSKLKFAEITNNINIIFDKYVIIKTKKFATYRKIKLKTLTDIEKEALQNFAQLNGFTIIHHK